jgi:hypothetical protein
MRKARSTFRITARPSHNTRLEQAPTLRQARAVISNATTTLIMDEKVLIELPHIKLIENEKMELIVIVEDTELNDYVEDFLCEEYELDCYGVEFYEKNNQNYYYNYYNAEDLKVLKKALLSLDLKEVERIFALNN